MRKWKVLTAIMAVAFVVPASFAQTQEDVLQELKALKSRVNALEAENVELKGDQGALELESQISALTDRLVAGTTVKSAANPVTLTGEFRFRNTWSFGDMAGTGDTEHDGSWTDSLVRLGIQYDFTRDVTAMAELQSKFAFGNNGAATNGNGEGDDVTAYQAWLEIRNLFGRAEFSTRTGRQEIVLGNQFQFGNADWYNGFTFDGTRWDWDSESFSLTGMAVKLNSNDGDINQISSFNNNHDDSELYSVYFTLKTIENHELDLYWIYVNGHGGSGANGTLGANNAGILTSNVVDNEYWHTIGGRIGGEFPGVGAGMDWNAELAYQFGDQDTGGADIDAFAAEVEFGITFNKDSMFRAYARMLYAEGPDDGDAGYQTLFPNRHSNSGFRARYGIADLSPMTNVFSLQGGIHFDPTADWTIGATVLWSEADEADAATVVSDDDYGWEIDIWAEYRYSEHLTFNTGVAFVFPDDDNAGAFNLDDDTHFIAYLQARLLF